MLVRADRLQRGFFKPRSSTSRLPTWEPPADVLETEDAVAVLVALPGVAPEKVEIYLDGGDIVVHGVRSFPNELNAAVIHRIELPQGRFERRVRLPPGRYASVGRSAVHGCILITLEKAGTSPS